MHNFFIAANFVKAQEKIINANLYLNSQEDFIKYNKALMDKFGI